MWESLYELARAAVPYWWALVPDLVLEGGRVTSLFWQNYDKWAAGFLTRERQRRWGKILVIAGLFVAVFLAYHDERTRHQATKVALTEAISKQAAPAMVGQRAWVGSWNAKLSAEPIAGEPLKIIIEYQNTGQEPARNFTFSIDTFTAPQDESNADGVKRHTMRFWEHCRSKSYTNSGQVIYPNSGLARMYTLTTQLDRHEVTEAVVAGERVVFVQGCFVYQTAQTVHLSSFCYYYQAGVTKIASLNFCLFGQYTD